jgi:hypothetical protein
MQVIYASKRKKRYPVLVSDEDFASLKKYSWHILDNGYVSTNLLKKKYYMHHLVCGYPDSGFVVDHKDGNRQNNTKENLHFITHKENSNNKHKETSSSFSDLSWSTKRIKVDEELTGSDILRIIELMKKDGKTEEEIKEALNGNSI